MAELLEYCLVFAVSVLFVGGAVAVYESFSGFVSALQFRLASSSISRLVAEAMANGSSSGSVNVPPSTLICAHGTISFSSGSMSEQEGVSAQCDFAMSLPGGARTFAFHFGSQLFTASVS